VKNSWHALPPRLHCSLSHWFASESMGHSLTRSRAARLKSAFVGIPVAIVVTRFVKGLLYGLSATDPASLAAAAFTLFAIGLIAAFLPAWRASCVDPNVALRYE